MTDPLTPNLRTAIHDAFYSVDAGGRPYELDTVTASRAVAKLVASVAADRDAAEAARDDVEGRLSELLCTLTDGKLSKTNYTVGTMVQAVEESFAKYARDEASESRDTAVADVLAKFEALADEASRLQPGIACVRPKAIRALIARIKKER